ncbi:MAG: efflux RND transporter periplasmic adaptor subunit [Candidatus Hydrogenedentes bacterium]|nr:efflux RND transporter periplasmic adaptor subunit [Candidatus Hydrogenedentota bacterium]
MARRKKLGTQVLGWLILFTVAAVPLSVVILREKTIEVTAITLRRGHVEQTAPAIASGTVMPLEDALVASEYLGKIVRVPLDEGAVVNPGDIVVELSHTDLDAQVALAEANLRAGESRVEQARLAAKIYAEVAATQVSQTSAQSEWAELEYNRIKSLFERKAISQNDLDKSALALRVARENHAAAIANQQQNQVRDEELRTAESGLEQLQSALTVAQATREKAFVRAPFTGVIGRIMVDVGEAVALGMPLLQLVKASEFYVEAPFDEANAAVIKVGQKARLNLDAYRGADFPGHVVFISPVVSVNPDLSRTLNVKFVVDEGADKFIPGMSADVLIVVDEKDGVLFVPSESLIRQEYAYVIERGRAVKRKVKTGVGNFNTMEILEGLKEGESLITSVSIKQLQEGVKVRVVDQLEEL